MHDVAMMSRYFMTPGREPLLEDVMTDPVVRLVMARDGVTLADLRDVITEARSRLLIRQLIQAEASFRSRRN